MDNFINSFSTENPNLAQTDSNIDIILPNWNQDNISRVDMAPLLMEDIDQLVAQIKETISPSWGEWGKDLVIEYLPNNLSIYRKDELLGTEEQLVRGDELIHTDTNELNKQLKIAKFEEVIQDKIGEINKKLLELLEKDDWQEKLQDIFGENWTKEEGEKIIKEIVQENKWPAIEIISGEILGSQGGYSPEREIIYIAEELGERTINNSDNLGEILAEELGHSVDGRLNGEQDSLGDEGAIFANLLYGEKVGIEIKRRWEKEDDFRLTTKRSYTTRAYLLRD